MATPFPSIDQSNPLVQELRDSFDRECLPEGGFEALDADIKRTYTRHARCGLVRARMADALSGRWGFRGTGGQIGEQLAMERTRVSDAALRGDITLDHFLMLEFHPDRPRDIEHRRFEHNVANRSGFIGVAQYFAQWETDLKSPSSSPLSEFDYELMCDVLQSIPEWLRARAAANPDFASAIINEIADDDSRDIIPVWCQPKEAGPTRALIRQLMSNSQSAFSYVNRLCEGWIRIFASTEAVTEELRWGDNR
ncbi:hypothetical protein RAS1_08120 [Phycisphaerae bacterium RAS1]|nr:hypothetical protein RAS1_08120 [Phycisphaerae bacterium RAS1]